MKNLKLIGAVGGAISLALCWPLAVGQIAQNVVTDGLAHVDNDDFSAEVINYDRGYLSSSVQTRISVDNESLKSQLVGEGLPTEVIIESHIQHGLVSVSSISTLPEYENSPLVINTSTQLNGSTSFELTVDDWNYQLEGHDIETVSVLSSHLKGDMTRLGEISFDLSLPSIAVNFVTGDSVTFSNLSGQGHGKSNDGFWVGKQTIGMQNMLVKDDMDQTLLNVDDMSYQFESQFDQTDVRFTSNHKINIGNIVSEQTPVKNFQMDFTLGDIDSKSFRAISNIYQSSSHLLQADIEKAIPHIDEMFSRGFFINFNPIVVKNGDAELSLKFMLNVPEGTNGVSQDPSVLLSALNGDFDTFVSNQFVADLPSMQKSLDELVIMEMMAQDDEGYRLKADIKDGNFVFSNGQQIPLFAIFMTGVMQRGF